MIMNDLTRGGCPCLFLRQWACIVCDVCPVARQTYGCLHSLRRCRYFLVTEAHCIWTACPGFPCLSLILKILDWNLRPSYDSSIIFHILNRWVAGISANHQSYVFLWAWLGEPWRRRPGPPPVDGPVDRVAASAAEYCMAEKSDDADVSTVGGDTSQPCGNSIMN